jgi:ectoine hydroxylase-related dioxygenase (phytanoyl-CoA dioxygenase family)
VQSFREDGFLFYGRVLTDRQLIDLREALDRVLNGKSSAQPERIANLGKDSNQVVTQVVNIWEAEPAFRRHLFHDLIAPMAAQLTGDDTLRVWHDQVQVKPAHIGGPTTWHQDHPYWPIIQPADLVSAWVALEDATISNGCMSMVRRSHKWGPHKGGTVGNNPDHSPSYDPDQIPAGETVEVVPVEVPAGSVVFHHCLTWHGAPPNHTANPRPAIAVHYMPGYTRYEPKGGHLVEHNIEVNPGEVLKGAHFPTIIENGKLLSA